MSQNTLHVTGKNGKKLGGGAAQLHRIKEYGGWDAYHKKIVESITKKVYAEVMDEMNRPVLKIVK